MKNIAVLKFGGSSVANNKNLDIVATKIIEFKNRFKNVIVIVSAQGKTTDNLVKEAEELSTLPNKREYDALISVGEQISASKLAILLNEKGYRAISLTGWQAGIYTSQDHSKAVITEINTARIKKEMEDKIVVITGFQGIDEIGDITTLGRGGSDTTAVAVAAALKADECNIFSDVEGVYSADPNKIKDAKKLQDITYDEMLELSYEGAKVLHTSCVEIGKNFEVPIIAESTFNNNIGTKIKNIKIEEDSIKSLVKNDNLILIKVPNTDINKVMKLVLDKKLLINNIRNSDKEVSFTINKKDLKLAIKVFDKINIEYKEVSKISIIGTGISNTITPLKDALGALQEVSADIYSINMNQNKLVIIFKSIIDDSLLQNLHKKLF